jgi:integrase
MFVFGYDEPYRNNKIRRHFNKYIEESGVKKIRIHDLRHSHVSLLRHLKFDRYEVAKRLGHTPEMVDNTYTHWFEKSQREMIDKLNKLDQ